ncbi:MAG: GAF domain-containing protein, partial [Candidatus Firestonebacteria bacterium]|nr:GAF domain-containing protein [Candidatus Firestonebacteria bacterium]
KKTLFENEENKLDLFSHSTLSILIQTDIYNKMNKIHSRKDVYYLDYHNKLESLKSMYSELEHVFIIAPSKGNTPKWLYLVSVANSIDKEFSPGEIFGDINLSNISFSRSKFPPYKFRTNSGLKKLVPIFDKSGNLVGILGFYLSFENANIHAKNLRNNIYIVFIFIVFALYMIYIFISSQIISPIHKLQENITRMSKGIYAPDVSTYSSKEFFDLAAGLNCLTEIIKEYGETSVKLENALKLNKAKFKVIIDSMLADGVFTVDKNMIITEFSKGAENITGFAREEAIGKYCKEIFHRDFCEENCALFHVAKSGSVVTNVESNIITKDNRIIPILSSSFPLKDDENNIIGSVESFRDITELKKMHEHLETAKNQALAYSNILKDQNKELLDTYTRLEETQHKTTDYMRKLENTNFLLDKKIIELSKLNEFSLALSSILNMEELLNVVTKNCIEQTNADSGSLMLMDVDRQELIVRVAYGDYYNYYQDITSAKVKVGDGISGWVAMNGEPLLVTNIEKDPRFKHLIRSRYKSKSLICVPLKIKDRVIGVLNINHKKTRESFNKADLDFLLTIINQAAIAIENTNLYEKLQRSYFETVHALTMAVEAKDDWTRGHSDRVIKYAVDIAKNLGLSDWQMENIRYGGALHDIGKIGISELIINKDRFLTKEEFAIIKKHPVIGASIIEPIEFLKPIRSIIRHHHEHYDGNGYPDGLEGENIIFEARILAVADAYDAMTSDRPYRNALSSQQALVELKKNAGTQFDPKIVGIFEDLLMRGMNEKIMLS